MHFEKIFMVSAKWYFLCCMNDKNRNAACLLDSGLYAIEGDGAAVATMLVGVVAFGAGAKVVGIIGKGVKAASKTKAVQALANRGGTAKTFLKTKARQAWTFVKEHQMNDKGAVGSVKKGKGSETNYGKSSNNLPDLFGKEVSHGKQGKHIVGHKNCIEGRSIFNGTVEDAQILIDEYMGTGVWLDNNKGRVDFGQIIGQNVILKGVTYLIQP